MMGRILGLAYAPILTVAMAACGNDPTAAGEADGLTSLAPLEAALHARAPAIAATCGNGTLEAGEQCDDGNLAAHDGCSAACTIEFVAQFSFTGAAGTEATFAADLADPALAATPVMSRGAGITPSTAADAFSASGWTTAAALDASDDFSFTVAPAAGKSMNLRALQLDERRSATGIRSWAVRSSLDGFAADLALFTVPDDTLARTQTVQLPAQFRNLAAPVEFRIFGFQAEAAGGTWRVDNVALIGGLSPICGNGFIDTGEQCDDGNAASHDGCSATCTIELVAQFSFTGATGTEATFAANLADPALAATPVMSRGAGVTPSTAADAFSASGWTTAAALDASDYFSFTVTPAAGNAMNLRTLQLDERRSATGIRSGAVRSSLDGFATDLALFTVPDDTLTRTQTIPLPAQFQSLAAPVEFRIFGFQAEAAGGTWRIDNVAVIGGLAQACGNGVVDPGEQCDDGNAQNLDGCNSSCQITAPLYFKASNTDGQDQFGFSVALSADGSTMAIGAVGESSAATGINGNQADNSLLVAGAVFVFTRSGATWTQQAYIKASSTDDFDAFGFSVALSADGSTLVVGAPFEDSAATGINGDPIDNSAPDAGAVYVFTRSGTTWTRQAYIKASNTDANDNFGNRVAVSADGSTLAVGAPFEASNATGVNGNQANNSANVNGATYVFTRSGATWSQQAYVKASNFAGLFGDSVALAADGSTLAVGASLENSAATGINGNQSDLSAASSGAAYLFTRSGTTWSQQAYIKASNTGANDRFGTAVALSSSGSTLAVGAFGEASAATGINGNQADNSAAGAGAAYVFTRSGTTWSQQAYVKASNTGANDSFGTAMALSGDGSILAVGSLAESSAATGIGGNQADNSAASAGAVYVFARSGTAWSQRSYVKASNTGTNDFFGKSVALLGDASMLAVGAQAEASAATGIGGNQADDSRFAAGAVYLYR